jgi:hypothetical protein
LAAALACAGFATITVTATLAAGRVQREGAWPDADKEVSLDVSGGSRAQALRALGDAAGWSLVIHARQGDEGDAIDVHVKEQPASRVLERLLDDGDYVARREGSLVSIERAAAPPASRSGANGANGANGAKGGPARGEDRTVMGGDVHIRKGETVGQVTVFGGNVDIAGEVAGDVTVFGGNVEVREGACVHGDASVFGGRLALANGSRIDGDVDAVGGAVERAPGAQVGGSVSTAGGAGDDDDDDDGPDDEAPSGPMPGLWTKAIRHVAHGFRLGAVLFVMGTVLLAVAGSRMAALRREMASRPMHSIAVGVVGGIAAAVVLVALCVTVIGVPIAIVALLVEILAVLGGMCAVVSVAGEGLLRHKTENPYVHLAVGCALVVGLASLPWVGDAVVALIVVAGTGVLVATRLAGFVPRRSRRDAPM